MRTPFPASVAISCLALAPSLAAQYGEPSVAELFEKAIGPSSELFGWAVAPLGDVNHDGFLDLAVSSPFASAGFRSSVGRVTAVSGADGSVLWFRKETRASAILGYSLETMDWNGDSVLDAVAGAPFADEGRTWIFSGVDGSTLAELVGFAQGDGFGASLATGGDYDGDGTLDLVIAAPSADTPGGGLDSGRVYVYARGATAPWTSLRGPYPGAEFGTGLAYAGDTTFPLGGASEIVAGCRDASSFFDGFASVHMWTGTGNFRRYVVGGVGMGFSLMGDRIDGGADLDGDGLHDFVVGDMNESEVDVFSGASGALLYAFDAGEPGDFGAPRLAPDADGDGLAEIVVGAWQSNAGGQDSGRVYVCSGASGAVLRTITPTSVQLNLGIDARPCEDFDGDGRGDLVVGAYGDGFSGSNLGGAFVFSGHLPAPQNVVLAAERPTDPQLFDVGGDATAGPITNSAIEPFRLALDCGGAPADGPFSLRVRRTSLAVPVQTPAGRRWIDGQLFFELGGLHQRDLVSFPAVVLPPDVGLWGLSFGAQGNCGGRLSNGLTQTIGR